MPPHHLLIASLGTSPRFEWRGEAFGVDSRKPLAMLCYLCMQDGPSERETLAELLWGRERLLNVRQALYQIRQLPGAEEWLQVDELVGVAAESDVKRFERAVANEEYGLALDLWNPPLLTELSVPRAPHFKEWLELEGSRLESLYLRALEHRAEQLERQGSFESALEMAERFLATDPLRESAYRAAMRLSYLLGDTDSALDHYRSCLRVLREELDAEPLPATVSLAETISSGRPLSVAVSPGHLPEELLRLLQTVVTGGGRLSTAELAAALELDEFSVAEGLVELERRRLLEPGGAVPEAIIEETRGTIPEPVRRLLHGRIARVLQESGAPERERETGEHWLGGHRPDLAAPLLLAALRRAVTSDRLDEAELLGYRVLWCGAREDRFEAGMLLEAVAERSGDGELQDDLLELLREIAWDLQEDVRLARLDLRRARRSMRLGELEPALRVAEEALSIARRLDGPLLLAQALNTMGVVNFMSGDLDQAHGYFGENRSSEITEERYRALNNLGAVAGLRGDLEASYGYLEEALTLARQHRNVGDVGACLNNLAATAERMARYPTAVERLKESRDLARRAGDGRTALHALLNISQIHLRRGDLGPAWNTADEALGEARERGDDRAQGQAHEQLAQVARYTGSHEEARRGFEAAVELFRRAGDERKLQAVRCNIAINELLAGDRSSVDEVVPLVADLAELGLSEIARWFWAELALLAPDAATVEELAPRIVAGGGNAHLELLASLARVRAELLEGGDAAGEADGLARELERVEIVEGPLGFLLLARTGCGESERFLQKATRLLEEQSLGLPRRLREPLLELPDRFETSLGL